jgi:hypothetical protein
MARRSRLAILMLTLIPAMACIHATFASDILLKRLSPDGQWVETETHLDVLPPMISRKGDWDKAIATINFRNKNASSNESIIIQATMAHTHSVFQPYPYCIAGFANNESRGSIFHWETIKCTSLYLQRSDDGGLLLEGTFILGQLRIDLPLTEIQVTTSYRSSVFDGDRFPKG